MFGLFKKKEVELSPIVREAIAQMQMEDDWQFDKYTRSISNGRFRVSSVDFSVAIWVAEEDRYAHYTHVGLGASKDENDVLRQYAAPLYQKKVDEFFSKLREKQFARLTRTDAGGGDDG